MTKNSFLSKIIPTEFSLWVLPAFLFLSVVCIYPFIDAIRMSFFIEQPGVEPKFVGIQNYITAFQDEVFIKALINSFIFTLGSVLFHWFLGLVSAILLNEIKGHLQHVFRGILFFPFLLPSSVVAVTWLLIYNPYLGFLNRWLQSMNIKLLGRDWLGNPSISIYAVTLVNIWKAFGLYTIVFFAGLQAIPKEIYEAASLDGAGRWGRFINITFPNLIPLMVTMVLIDIIWTFRYFDLIWIMTQGGPLHSSEIVPTYLYQVGILQLRFGYAAAQGVIMLLLMFIFIIPSLKAWEEG